jgi:hypothetical protein
MINIFLILRVLYYETWALIVLGVSGVGHVSATLTHDYVELCCVIKLL